MTDPQHPVGWVAPEPVPGPGPGMEFGGAGARLVGYIIDTVITFAAIFMLILVFAIVSTLLPAIGILGIFLSFIIVEFGYFPYFWSKSGQTPGMKVMNIKVVRDADGGPVTMGSAILRLIGYWVSSLVFYIGFIWIFIDKRQRGWFDLIAGTVVIKA